jgi:hypothetical protein
VVAPHVVAALLPIKVLILFSKSPHCLSPKARLRTAKFPTGVALVGVHRTFLPLSLSFVFRKNKPLRIWITSRLFNAESVYLAARVGRGRRQESVLALLQVGQIDLERSRRDLLELDWYPVQAHNPAPGDEVTAALT